MAALASSQIGADGQPVPGRRWLADPGSTEVRRHGEDDRVCDRVDERRWDAESMSSRVTAAARRVAAGRICTYCGSEALDGTQSPEHPIPVVLDSRITVYTVCDDCNRRAGTEIDKPFLEHFMVLAERHRWATEDPRHRTRRLRHPLMTGTFRDERGHVVVVGDDGRPRYPGSVVRAGDRITIAAETEARAAELLERVRAQAAASGQEVADWKQERHEGTPWLTRTISTSLTVGVRMGAKLGLAFGSEAYPETWRLSAEAAQLREWLWSPHPVNCAGEPIGWMPTRDVEHPFADPPNHVAFFLSSSSAVLLTVLVYGSIGFTVPVAPPETPASRIAWRSGPAHGGAVVTTFDELMLRVIRSLMDADS